MHSTTLDSSKPKRLAGRNHIVPDNTFGVSREKRDKVLSHKYFSPPTGVYSPKFNITDPNDKVTKLVPNCSSPERDPRFDYSKTNTLFWYPNQRVIEDTKIAFYNNVAKCDKCDRKDNHKHMPNGMTVTNGSVEGSQENSQSPRRDSKDM
jgi:hypothetical protein